MARNLPPGGSISGLCPKCSGGRTGELSFRVTKLVTGGIAYKCHRASCDNAGLRPAVPGEPQQIIPPFQPRPYPYDLTVPGPDHPLWNLLRVIPEARTPELCARIGLYHREGDSGEIVWAIVDYDWSLRGHVSRTYPGKVIRTWRESPGPFCGYFSNIRHPDLWLVEDPVSAARIQLEGRSALCLLGTHFSLEGQQELRDRGGLAKRIFVALDPDAYNVSQELAKTLTFRLGRDTVAVPLEKDPKDMDQKELRALLYPDA